MKILYTIILIISLYKSIAKFELDRSTIKTENKIGITFQYYDVDYPNLISNIDCEFKKEKLCPEGIEMHSFELYIKAGEKKLLPIKQDSASYANINILCPEMISKNPYNLFEKNIHSLVRNFLYKKLNSCVILDKDNIDPFTKMHAIVFNVDGNKENHDNVYNIDNMEHDFKNVNNMSKALGMALNKKLQALYIEKTNELSFDRSDRNSQQYKDSLKNDIKNENEMNVTADSKNSQPFIKDLENKEKLDNGSDGKKIKSELKNQEIKGNKNKEIEGWIYTMDGMFMFLFTLFY